jgi:hypothetical protein
VGKRGVQGAWLCVSVFANTLTELPEAAGLEVARAFYKQLKYFKQAQYSGHNPKRFQHGTLGVKYENIKI